ncbi:hypothetical protein LHYA1_G007285 [Lachnellula hyalina]|uniref:Uncharacterized protein n=1 Tax=Lachnellula hyalina TaxID=1316788 RepID=A0A8H8QUZ6_9HELO|nr:uncharacterized protein LHYA1_G007285 [Lachnellula hyalina]TVY23234.1 hypothetical protein LHYA1_G007285 [Lachnellula hyalina]
MGGQGFLKTRRVESPLDVCLPLRKSEIRDNGSKSLSVPSAGLGEDVPFYTCGDQQNSCEAFGQPAICCPVRTACNPTTVEISPSGIFCCNSALNPEGCFVSTHNPPVCMAGTTECSRETGGGCCPENTICSPNGCIHAVPVWIISSSVVTVGASSLSPTSGAGGTESLATITKTVTERPAATATMVKDGEVAQSGVRKDSVILSFPYAIAWMLVCVAALMRLL